MLGGFIWAELGSRLPHVGGQYVYLARAYPPIVGFLYGVALLFIIFGQTFDKVITILAFFFVANYTLSFISVFVLRRREPEKERPYRAWGHPWTTALALIGSILFLAGAIASDTENSLYAIILLAVSYPLFRVMKAVA